MDDDRIVSTDSDLFAISERLQLVSIDGGDNIRCCTADSLKSDEELARILQVFAFAFAFAFAFSLPFAFAGCLNSKLETWGLHDNLLCLGNGFLVCRPRNRRF